jgi:2-isopropylmalate synthase
MLKARETYEIMRAEDVGWTANKIVLGKLSGRNAFKQRLQELGIELESEADINAAFTRFKELADRKSDIFDEDIMALVSDEQQSQESEYYRFIVAVAAIEYRRNADRQGGVPIDGEEHARGKGDGPVDATVNAIESKSAAAPNWCCSRSTPSAPAPSLRVR